MSLPLKNLSKFFLGLLGLFGLVTACFYLPNTAAKLGLNPMAGVISGFRWALLGTEMPGAMMLVSVIVVLLVLVSGAFYFRRMEQYYADVV